MRTFEFTGGGSAKFWHVGRDGAQVTVRYGRLGTTGQTQVKDLSSEADAVAHVDKLVAEKVKKGYVEGGAAPAVAVEAPEPAVIVGATAVDEDEFSVPSGWLRFHYARRGGRGIGDPAVSPAARQAATEFLESHRDWLAGCLTAAFVTDDIGAEGRAWLAAPATATPLGAAVITVLLVHRLDYRDRDKAGRIADLVLSRHDAGFAAEAMVAAMTLQVVGSAHQAAGGQRVAVQRTTTAPEYGYWADAHLDIVRGRVRAALAAATDERYAAAVEALGALRTESPQQRVVTSFLAPTQVDWVEADCAEVSAHQHGGLALLLLSSVTTTEQAALVFPYVNAWTLTFQTAALYTFVEGLGSAAARYVDELFANGYVGTDERRRLFTILGALPTDEAFRMMLDRADEKGARPALAEAAGRFPRRALRMLADAGARAVPGELLRAHVMNNPDLVVELLPELAPAAAGRVRAILESRVDVVEAAPADVPPLLVTPPWTVKRAVRKPVVVEGLVCDDPTGIDWLPGERQEWAATHSWVSHWSQPEDTDWRRVTAEIRGGRSPWHRGISFLLNAPEAYALPVVGEWRAGDFWDSAGWGRRLVARFELAAFPAMLDAARRNAAGISVAMMAYTGPEVATLMADWLARLKLARAVALAWLTRHPRSAARALVPAALGRPGTARRNAELALRAIAGAGHGDTVLAAAGDHGAAARAGIGTLLSLDPVDVVPDRMPKVPEWATAALLPRIQLRGGRGVLPVAAAQHVITMLAISKRGEPYAGLAVVQEACDPHSLAEFAWGGFQLWLTAGAPAKENWAFDALGVFGDDDVVRRLAPLIRAWPGEGGHARAVTGLDLLTAIGTDVALMHLNGIAQKVKFRGLKDKATEKVAEVAEALGLTPEQLADRLIPDFGLDPNGSITLDYGPRQFVVGFDEQLKPVITDETGKRRKDLPKPAAKDDPELAPEAQRRFAGLKKDVRTVAADQIRRLEQSMITGRRWSGADFKLYFVAHPLLWHIVRRLVWGLFDDTGALVGAVRVAEDRTFADVDDNPVELADAATVGVAHPLHLGDAVPAWSEVFADYEILQPFAQLGRETYTLSAQDAAAGELTRYVGVEVPTTTVLGLERRGWRRGDPQDGGVQGWLERDLAGGGTVVLNLDPGIAVGSLEIFEKQKLSGVWATKGAMWGWRQEGGLHLRDLDPVTVSELIRDLEELTA